MKRPGEDHDASEQRSVDGDEHVGTVAKQPQFFESDLRSFDHRASPEVPQRRSAAQGKRQKHNQNFRKAKLYFRGGV